MLHPPSPQNLSALRFCYNMHHFCLVRKVSMEREPLNPKREEAVRRAANRWQEQLVDVSGRNRLLNYRDLRVGTLDLTPGPDSQIKPQILDSLLDGKAIYLSSLYAGVEPTALELASMRSNQVEQTDLIADQGAITDARKRLSTIYRKSQEYFDEKGINTLFAAGGLATWSVTDQSYNAPVVLVPITVSPVDATRLNFKIEVSGDHISTRC